MKNLAHLVFAAAAGAVLGAGGLTLALANQAEPAGLSVKKLSERDVVETLNGKEARVTMAELTLEPGAAGKPHRHAGPVFGYILEGEFEVGFDDEPAKTLKAGETFYEPGGILHRVSKNPSKDAKCRVLAVLLHPRDAKRLSIPVESD